LQREDIGLPSELYLTTQVESSACGGVRDHKRPETIYFLGFTLYCTRNRKGNFRVGLRAEKSRLRRALMRLQDQMRRMRHLSIREQTDCLIQMLRGRRPSKLIESDECFSVEVLGTSGILYKEVTERWTLLRTADIWNAMWTCSLVQLCPAVETASRRRNNQQGKAQRHP
jgi:hypothetical protein